jgi:hypothetical protein
VAITGGFGHIGLMRLLPAITRRGLLAGLGSAALLPPALARAASPLGVVELFTSQGCSSCPPADAFAAELATEPGVTVLTYHVDYWDYLGWKDTLGGAAFSQRQYDYAKQRGDMDVYTPQMIVNGGPHFSGSDKAAVLAALGRAPSAGPSLRLSQSGKMLQVAIGAAAASGDATLWLLPVAAEVDVEILKGENAGKTIHYHNVVRDVVPAGMWAGAAATVALPLESVMPKNCSGCVAVLQQANAGPVLASAVWGELARS